VAREAQMQARETSMKLQILRGTVVSFLLPCFVSRHDAKMRRRRGDEETGE
jgi:hypothetical protein